MLNWTWAAIRTKVENDLDLISEDFITPTEILGYANEAIDDVEAEIHTLYQDYFLTSAYLPLVAGTNLYSLPTDIYANKLRSIVYDDGSTKYIIKRVKNLADLSLVQTADDYQHILTNSGTSGVQINLYPTSRETSSTNVKIWYLRNAARLSLDTDTCDIPEFVNYVIQHIKTRCLEKEGHPNMASAQQRLQTLRQLMIETLQDMTDDENTTIDPDFSFYQDFDIGIRRQG